MCVYYTFCRDTGLLYCFSLKFDTVYCVCVCLCYNDIFLMILCEFNDNTYKMNRIVFF